MRQQLPSTVQRNSRGMDEARQLFGQAISDREFCCCCFFCFFVFLHRAAMDPLIGPQDSLA